jgi:abequosyltransferase
MITMASNSGICQLSICIPTLNRAGYLKGLLQNIVDQNNSFSFNEVEIVIVDGGSTDKTESIARIFMDLGLNINYFKRQIKSGIDEDILKSIEIAKGTYCWLFSDDDRFCNNAIGTVLNKLREHEILSGCFCNRLSFDDKMKYRVPEISSWPHKLLKKDYLFTDKDSCFIFLGMDMGFISSQIVNRKMWQKAITTKALDGFYNCYLMVYIMGLMMEDHCRWLYINEPVVKQRTGNDSFLLRSGIYQRQIIEHEGLSKVIQAHYSKKSIIYRIVFKRMVLRLPRAVANMKSFNPPYHIQLKILALYYKKYRKYPSLWLSVFPLFIVPNYFNKTIKNMYFNYKVWAANRKYE